MPEHSTLNAALYHEGSQLHGEPVEPRHHLQIHVTGSAPPEFEVYERIVLNQLYKHLPQ